MSTNSTGGDTDGGGGASPSGEGQWSRSVGEVDPFSVFVVNSLPMGADLRSARPAASQPRLEPRKAAGAMGGE